MARIAPPETPLQPSPEQDAVVAARRADPAGSLRVVAFAGSGKTTALDAATTALEGAGYRVIGTSTSWPAPVARWCTTAASTE